MCIPSAVVRLQINLEFKENEFQLIRQLLDFSSLVMTSIMKYRPTEFWKATYIEKKMPEVVKKKIMEGKTPPDL